MALDRSVPVLHMRVGSYPVHHGSLGLVRTLGRAGVRVFAVTESRYTPSALSRYLYKAFVWPTTGYENQQQLVSGLQQLGERIGSRAVLLTTDDEAALLVAEHASELRDRFLLADIPPELPRQLATKSTLTALCASAGVSTAACIRPGSIEELLNAATAIGFPVALKNDAPWERISNRAVSGTTIVRAPHELVELVSEWTSLPGVVVQEYLPHEETEDWSVYIYCGREDDCVIAFTARKLRSFPAYTGITAEGISAANEELRERAIAFCRTVGFRGVASMDWRLDLRDRTYKLLDFNVRIGGKFRALETEQGVDVVRALHLDLTGRAVPIAREIQERRFVAGNLAAPAALVYRRQRSTPRIVRRPPGGIERAWFALDDPIPGLVTALRTAPLARHIARADLRRGLVATATPQSADEFEPSSATAAAERQSVGSIPGSPPGPHGEPD